MDFWDDYDHQDPKVFYITENMRTREIEDSIKDELCGCSCSGACSPQQCECLERSGASYSFLERDDLASYVLEITNADKPLYECNNNCKCARKICGNRLVQCGPRKNLRVVETEGKGAGLRTDDRVEKGNFICEYAGEVVTRREAQRRFEIYARNESNHNYVFCVREHFGERSEGTFIDPTFYGNIGRYINHSCDPNCILVLIRIENSLPRLCIFANRAISRNSEITFDYGDYNGSGSDLSKKKCLCGAVNCRQFLPFNRDV